MYSERPQDISSVIDFFFLAMCDKLAKEVADIGIDV